MAEAKGKKGKEIGKPKEAAVKKEPKKEAKAQISAAELMEASGLFMHPLISEKAIGMIEKENKITFIVRKSAGKADIKKAFEGIYDAKVKKINIIKDMKGRKKAIIKLGADYKAENVATKLGII